MKLSDMLETNLQLIKVGTFPGELSEVVSSVKNFITQFKAQVDAKAAATEATAEGTQRTEDPKPVQQPS